MEAMTSKISLHVGAETGSPQFFCLIFIIFSLGEDLEAMASQFENKLNQEEQWLHRMAEL